MCVCEWIYIQTNVSLECNLCLALEETAANAQNFCQLAILMWKKRADAGAETVGGAAKKHFA